VLALVDDDRSVEDICRALHANEFFVCRVLMRQFAAGRIKVVRPRGAPAAAAAPGGEPLPAGLPTAEGLVELGRQLLDRKELEAALRHARAARALEPDNPRVGAAAQKLEDRLRKELEQSGLQLDGVPVLAKPMEELAKLPLSPQEGFALTRVDGSSDVASLIKLGPMPALDAQILFLQLQKNGLIRIQTRH
jgi:hypothetical protein